MTPTGVAIREVRPQLFDAAERVLLRAGPQALTSRAVTTEAGCAKGVLHRHFADFDTFLAELVTDRIARIDGPADALIGTAGAGTVIGNLTGALTELFGSVALRIVGLVISRDDLRARLRRTTPTGVPLLAEATDMVARYLHAERRAGRLTGDAEVDLLAPTLVGAAHLLFADPDRSTPDAAAVARTVGTVLGGALHPPTTGSAHDGRA
ncbi:TetR/AcrR family transcriptional regulator [Streptomyces sp. NPDC127068]|uniref:TetR/AcrR family transcriptional regulator n=1 Tax=Streptomyces sp. NPDC127068 TaxID=3347127 RepID=UPI003652B5BD